MGTEIPESYLDKEIYSKLCSDKYTRMVISVDAEYEGEKTFNLVKKIRSTAEKYNCKMSQGSVGMALGKRRSLTYYGCNEEDGP